MYRAKILTITAFLVFAAIFLTWTPDRGIATGVTGGQLPAPTGVRASDGDYADKVGIQWDTVRGAATYRIFRNTTNNPGGATDVGTSLSNYFFDTTAVVEQQYFYWVRAENGANISGLGTSDEGVRADGFIFPGPFPPLEPPPAPPENPVTAAKASLGKTLFWDEQLSSTRTVACGTCHRPAAGGSDPRSQTDGLLTTNPGFDAMFGTADDVIGSQGVPQNNEDGTYTESPLFGPRTQVTGRKAPSYLNAGYSLNGLFWDGRANDTFRDPLTNQILIPSGASLESQVLGPPVNSMEMAHGGRDWSQVAARIAGAKPLALAHDIPTSLSAWIDGRNYPELFTEAFGTPEVTPARIAMAIATHERQLFSDRTPLDRWAASIEPLTDQEQEGLDIFLNAQCNVCHDTGLMSDNAFHNIAVRPVIEDRGRGGITNNEGNDGQFKTPTLRNVELHAPYMHNGRFPTLESVVEFYNRGGDFDAPNVDRNLIRALGLSTEGKAALVAFMKRPLTDLRVANELPPFDRPQLYTESDRVPEITGAGRVGTGDVEPKAIAIEPPIVGNPSFTVAVADGAAGAEAVLVISSFDPGIGTTIPTFGTFARETAVLSGTGHGSVSLEIPDSPALVGQTFYGRWYVTDAAASRGFSVSKLIVFSVFGESSVPAAAVHADFDGDRRTDISIFRPGDGQWWYLRSSDSENRAFQFGLESDTLVPADFSGDGTADIAIWRPSTAEWYILRSQDSTVSTFIYGASGDIPLPGDFDGDHTADAAVFRPSEGSWHILLSSGGSRIEGFGSSGDFPVQGDFDGDGLAETAIWRAATGEWWLRRSSDGQVNVFQFGVSSDVPVPADFTGDGRTDIAVWRPTEGGWYVLRSEDLSYYAFSFGVSGDIPAPGDYDGDGRTDAAIYRPSTGVWYIDRTTAGIGIFSYGAAGDIPVPAAYVP